MPLETTIKEIMSRRERAYPAALHGSIMRRMRFQNPLVAGALWCAVSATAFFGVFSGWQLASALRELSAWEFFSVAIETLSTDALSLPLFTEAAATFLPTEWVIAFAGDVALLTIGLIALRRIRQA